MVLTNFVAPVRNPGSASSALLDVSRYLDSTVVLGGTNWVGSLYQALCVRPRRVDHDILGMSFRLRYSATGPGVPRAESLTLDLYASAGTGSATYPVGTPIRTGIIPLDGTPIPVLGGTGLVSDGGLTSVLQNCLVLFEEPLPAPDTKIFYWIVAYPTSLVPLGDYLSGQLVASTDNFSCRSGPSFPSPNLHPTQTPTSGNAGYTMGLFYQADPDDAFIKDWTYNPHFGPPFGYRAGADLNWAPVQSNVSWSFDLTRILFGTEPQPPPSGGAQIKFSGTCPAFTQGLVFKLRAQTLSGGSGSVRLVVDVSIDGGGSYINAYTSPSPTGLSYDPYETDIHVGYDATAGQFVTNYRISAQAAPFGFGFQCTMNLTTVDAKVQVEIGSDLFLAAWGSNPNRSGSALVSRYMGTAPLPLTVPPGNTPWSVSPNQITPETNSGVPLAMSAIATPTRVRVLTHGTFPTYNVQQWGMRIGPSNRAEIVNDFPVPQPGQVTTNGQAGAPIAFWRPPVMRFAYGSGSVSTASTWRVSMATLGAGGYSGVTAVKPSTNQQTILGAAQNVDPYLEVASWIGVFFFESGTELLGPSNLRRLWIYSESPGGVGNLQTTGGWVQGTQGTPGASNTRGVRLGRVTLPGGVRNDPNANAIVFMYQTLLPHRTLAPPNTENGMTFGVLFQHTVITSTNVYIDNPVPSGWVLYTGCQPFDNFDRIVPLGVMASQDGSGVFWILIGVEQDSDGGGNNGTGGHCGVAVPHLISGPPYTITKGDPEIFTGSINWSVVSREADDLVANWIPSEERYLVWYSITSPSDSAARFYVYKWFDETPIISPSQFLNAAQTFFVGV